MDAKKLSFAVRSKTRRKILTALETNKMPSQLKKELKLEDSNVARALRELEKESLIKCITSPAKMGKIYQLTKEGKRIMEEAMKIYPNN
ncbi:MAG: winged helix-turn-helix domain-containing protein [Nanoarchaeota archaeon]|nr:winged helix-turn-helix domain-containing protein [Nanoarchaeota archaeon]